MLEEVPRQIFATVSNRLRLAGRECDEALTLVRYYMYMPNGYWPWPDDYAQLSDRERRIDEAILSEINRVCELATSAGAARAGFDISRITAAQMRVTTTTVKPRGRGRVRAKSGHRK